MSVQDEQLSEHDNPYQAGQHEAVATFSEEMREAKSRLAFLRPVRNAGVFGLVAGLLIGLFVQGFIASPLDAPPLTTNPNFLIFLVVMPPVAGCIFGGLMALVAVGLHGIWKFYLGLK